jgi:hypothetical protein
MSGIVTVVEAAETARLQLPKSEYVVKAASADTSLKTATAKNAAACKACFTWFMRSLLDF